MKIIGLMPVRNEDWCLGLTLRAALMWCDEVIVALHACTDRSSAIFLEVARETLTDRNRCHVVMLFERTWTEMAHRQKLLFMARSYGATHIAMIDADEVLTGNLLTSVQNRILCLKEGETLQLPWLALPRNITSYITSGPWGPGQQVSMAFRDHPSAHWATRDGYDFHHRHAMGLPPGRFTAPLKPADGGIMHLQFVSERRLRAKQALYQAIEVLRWPGRSTPEQLAQQYGRAVYESVPEKVKQELIPLSWWEPYRKLAHHLDLSDLAAPWQELELQRLVAEYGREKFAGLDFFGVA